MQSLLGLGQDVNGVTTANQDHVIKNEQPIECDYWLSPSLVAMAAYVLNTCPIHSRYIRRGRREHKVKAVDEFFITSKEVIMVLSFNPNDPKETDLMYKLYTFCRLFLLAERCKI